MGRRLANFPGCCKSCVKMLGPSRPLVGRTDPIGSRIGGQLLCYRQPRHLPRRRAAAIRRKNRLRSRHALVTMSAHREALTGRPQIKIRLPAQKDCLSDQRLEDQIRSLRVIGAPFLLARSASSKAAQPLIRLRPSSTILYLAPIFTRALRGMVNC